MHISLLIVKSLNDFIHSFFSLQTQMSDWIDRFRIKFILKLFYIASSSLIYYVAFRCYISFIVLRITSTYWIIKDDGAESFIMRGYASKIRRVEIRLFKLIRLLTILIVICRIKFELTLFQTSSQIILYI